jgi:2-methylcitrate dehydratase PrpD
MRETQAQRLAEFFTALRPDDLPERVVEDARRRVMDTVGVALAGSRMDYAVPVYDVMVGMGGREEATVWGSGDRLPAANAGFVNAAYTHGPDYDDTHSVAMVHIGCLAVPSALAMAERSGASGAQMITALVAGAEVGLRVGAATPHRFHMRGYHATGVVGAFTSVTASALLLGLDEAQLANGLGLAGSQAFGLLQYLHDGSWVKRLHPGWSVQAGITSALLVERGFTGPPLVFEGGNGLYNVLLHGDSEPVQWDTLSGGLGERWLLQETTFKPYSSGAWNHSAMDAVAAIMRAERLSSADVERIDASVPLECIPVVCEPREAKIHPATPYHMKFSLPYSVAILVALGHAGVDDYGEDVYRNEEIADLAARVHCHGDPTMGPSRFPARVTLRTHDGRTFEHEVRSQRGGPGNPFTADDHRDKFRTNAGPSLGAERTEQLLHAIEEVWEAPSVGELVRLSGRG